MIASQDRFKGELTHSGPAIYRLNNDRAGNELAELEAGHSHHGQQGILQGVLVYNDPFVQPFSSCGANIVGTKDIEHTGPGHPAVERQVDARQRYGRQEKVVESVK